MTGLALSTFIWKSSAPWLALLYLTQWMYISVSSSYILLSLGHFFNGDFNTDKDKYIAPKRALQPFQTTDPNITDCARLWKWGTLLYEFQLPLALLVFIIYFIVELPGRIKQDLAKPNNNFFMYTVGIYGTSIGHALPFLLGLIEFFSSSIRLRWRHATFHYFLLCAYNVLNATYGIANKTSIYS